MITTKTYIIFLQKFGADTGGKGTSTARLLRDEMQDLDRQNTDLKQEVRDLQQDLANERRTAEKVISYILDDLFMPPNFEEV